MVILNTLLHATWQCSQLDKHWASQMDHAVVKQTCRSATPVPLAHGYPALWPPVIMLLWRRRCGCFAGTVPLPGLQLLGAADVNQQQLLGAMQNFMQLGGAANSYLDAAPGDNDVAMAAGLGDGVSLAWPVRLPCFCCCACRHAVPSCTVYAERSCPPLGECKLCFLVNKSPLRRYCSL